MPENHRRKTPKDTSTEVIVQSSQFGQSVGDEPVSLPYGYDENKNEDGRVWSFELCLREHVTR